MPRAHQVERERVGQVEAEEGIELSPVVLARGADERLDHEQRRHDEEEPGACALGRSQGHVARVAERERPARARASQWRQRPKTANRIPIPPSRAISERTLQTTTFAVGLLSTRGSGGQLFV